MQHHLSSSPTVIDPWILEFSQVIQIASGETNPDLHEQFTATPNFSAGHLAFPCFQLAKKLKISPAQVAEQLRAAAQKYLENNETIKYITSVKSVGPYLNVFWDFSKIMEDWIELVVAKKYFHQLYSKAVPPKTMLEYSQPNTHKEMHVGHMRNVCLGQAIVKVLRYCGMDVISATYPGDVGTHVAKCLWYIHKIKAKAPSEHKGAWLGSMYSQAHNLLEAERGTPSEEANRLALTNILQEIHSGQGSFFDEWKQTREWSITLMKQVYEWLNVDFDYWYFESDVDVPSLKLVDEYLAKGLFKIDEGAVGCDLSEDNLGFALLRKSDGNGLYATKDLELARRKFQEMQIEKSLYLVDVRQSLHFKQFFKILEKMGFEQSKDCVHLPYEMVELPSGAMSSRKGNIVPIEQLIDEMQETIVNEYLSHYKSEWSVEQIKKTAQQVANGAIKYGMVRVDPQKKIVFDLKEWLRLDGNSGPYLQYTATRLQSILSKNSFNIEATPKPRSSFLPENLNNAEVELIVKLMQFHNVVWQAGQKFAIHLVANYLFELSQAVNTFYVQSPIMNETNVDKRQDRLMIVWLSQAILAKGLALLGIECPEKM
ncbi:MAG: arginine--tRNA ligase [Bacteriovoracaceae bacterium]|nr:arginine--tRNA ligase [Bacteriovoracaceae bacterium]